MEAATSGQGEQQSFPEQDQILAHNLADPQNPLIHDWKLEQEKCNTECLIQCFQSERAALQFLQNILDPTNEDEDRFGAGMPMQLTHSVPTKVLNEFTKFLLKDVIDNDDQGDALCNTLREMISNWDEETWIREHQRNKNNLRTMMISRGIAVPETSRHKNVGMTMAEALRDVKLASNLERNDENIQSENEDQNTNEQTEGYEKDEAEKVNERKTDRDCLSTKEGQKKQSEKRVVTKNTPELGMDSESQSTKTRLRGYDGVERISDITKAISNDVQYSGAPDESLSEAVSALHDAMLLSKIDPGNDHVALIAFPLILKDPARRVFRKEIGPYVTSVREACNTLLREFLPDEVRIVNDQVWMELSLKTMTAETNVEKLDLLVRRWIHWN